MGQKLFQINLDSIIISSDALARVFNFTQFNRRTIGLFVQTYLRTLQNGFSNGPTSASFHLFSVFLQQINVKKCHVHPVYSAVIWTHDLSKTSRLP